jgi:Zn-dependent M28 family amino/carboxypeptidase
MLNMDMVGRNDLDSLQLIGGALAPDLLRITMEENARVGFTLEDARLAFGGSDHMSFTKRKVPSLFFHSGLHPEYHQVTDEAKLINNDKVARTATLVFYVALRVANEPARPRYVGQPVSLLP